MHILVTSATTFIFCLSGIGIVHAESYDGVATHFQAIGSPYGACGVPESVLATDATDSALKGRSDLNYVALNVFDAPGNYGSPADFGGRPLTGDNLKYLGMYANGANCGRWVRIELGDECNGTNDGAPNEEFCRGGTGWYSDERNGAVLYAVVTDQCTDNNAWCRDSKYHLDIHTPALNDFEKDGVRIAPLANGSSSENWVATGFNNRKISWSFTRAPLYQGDIHIFFSQASKAYYMRILITNLPNGIHRVEQSTGTDGSGNDIWQAATMEGDMGQMWILPKSDAFTGIRIRVYDASDSLVAGGRIYEFDYPAACGTECTAAATGVEYKAIGGTDETSKIETRKRIQIRAEYALFFVLLGRRR